jgi:transketolase
MAIAERGLAARYGDLVDHYTHVIVGDGCLMEGVSHEAIDLAGHLQLSRLIVMWDDNRITIDGSTELSTGMDQRARFAAAGWHTIAVDGHNPAAIEAALAEARAESRPTLIACRTVIGYGAPNKQGTEATHGAPLGAAEVEAARAKLGWPYPPFEIPADIATAWRAAGERSRSVRLAWDNRLAAHPERARFEAAIRGDIPTGFPERIAAHKVELVANAPSVASRKASEMALEVINAAIEVTLGGSADLTHSNLTITKGLGSLKACDFSGRYIRYGVREFGMAAAMNGIALHGGFIPYGGTFFVFSDYARSAIRLSALMGVRVIYVLTHDSIGLGEDGPTHQPLEHLAMLRATPNLHVFRPCDAIETAECWELALASKSTPSALLLSRQNLPTLRASAEDNESARGGYVLREAHGPRDLTLLATSSEASLAIDAANALRKNGKRLAVVSMPSWDLFEAQSADYRAEVLGSAPRIAIEAAARFGWDRWIGERGAFVGMNGFGASAPAGDLYKHFGITVDAIVAAAAGLAPHPRG